MATKPKLLTPWPFTEKSPDPFSRMPACRVFFTGLIAAWHVPVCPPFACVFFPSLRSKCRGAGAFPCSLLHPRCWEQCRAHSRHFVSGDPSKAPGGLPCATQLSPLLPPATAQCACVQTPGRADHTLAASGSHRSSPSQATCGEAERGPAWGPEALQSGELSPSHVPLASLNHKPPSSAAHSASCQNRCF